MVAQFDARTTELFRLLAFEPTGPEQAEILASPYRFELISGGGQSGKSTLASKKLMMHLPGDVELAVANGWTFPLSYWLVAPDYAKTAKEFEYIKWDLRRLGLLNARGSTKRVDPGHIEVKGRGPNSIVATIDTKSGMDITKLAMDAPSGIILCEPATLDYEAYLRVMERAGYRKAWVFIAGTMEGSIGWFPALRQEWAWGHDDRKAFSLPSYSNWHFYPGGKNDPEILRIKAESPDSFYMERIEGVPCPPKGLVIPEFSTSLHVRDVSYTPGLPVHVWVDPGYRHHCAVEAAQVVNEQVRIIDEVYERGLTVRQVIDVCEARPWWGEELFGVIDIAGWAHAGQQSPAAEVWQALPPEGAGLYMKSNRVLVNEGTDVFRSFLGINPLTKEPRMVISPRCRGLISELGGLPSPLDNQVHVYKWRIGNDGLPVGKVPEDRNNDAVKAVVYGLVAVFGYGGVKRGAQVVKVRRMKRG